MNCTDNFQLYPNGQLADRKNYEASKGQSLWERIGSYATYIHHRNLMNKDDSFAARFAGTCAQFFQTQNNASYENGRYLKTATISRLSKLCTYTIGTVLSSGAELAIRIGQLVCFTLKLLFDTTVGLLIELINTRIHRDRPADFKKRFRSIQRDLSEISNATQYIIRNALKILPIAGPFLAQASDYVRVALIDGAEVVCTKAKSIFSPQASTENSKTQNEAEADEAEEEEKKHPLKLADEDRTSSQLHEIS